MDRRIPIGLVALLVVSTTTAPALAAPAVGGVAEPDDSNGIVETNASAARADVEFSTRDPADSVAVADSAGSADATEPPGKVVFDRDVFREQRGDRIYIPITFETGSIVDLKIYGPGFDAELKVRDRNDDDRVVVIINSYRGGDPAEGYEPLDPGDEIGISQLFREVETLPVGEYDLRLFTDTSRDKASLFVEERRTDGVTLFRAPTTTFDELDTTDAVRSAIEAGRVSQLAQLDGSPALANGDVLVVRLEGTGFGGAVTKPRDQDVSLLFRRITGCEATDELLTGLESEVVVDSKRNEYYAVIDTEELRVTRVPGVTGGCDTALAPGDRASVELRFPTGSALVADGGDGENATFGPFTVVGRTVTLDDLALSPAADQSVSGTTTLAPGTELTVRVAGAGFDQMQSTNVTTEGRFDTSFDLSTVDRFSNLTVTVAAANQPLTNGTRSVVVGGNTPTVRISGQSVGADTASVAVDLASLPDGGFVVLEHDGTVLGSSAYHEGVVRGLSVPYDDPPSGTADVRAVVYRDANGNEEFDDADEPYVVDGQPAASTATVAFPENTTTQPPTTTTPAPRPASVGGNDLVGLIVVFLILTGSIGLAVRES